MTGVRLGAPWRWGPITGRLWPRVLPSLRVGFFARLFGVARQPVTSIGALGLGPTEVEGTGATISPVFDPLSGEPAIALRYRSIAPSTSAVLYVGLTSREGNLVDEAQQATDFLLDDGTGTALIRVSPGRDVARVHARGLEIHGMSLRARVELLRAGDAVRVRGEVVELFRSSPHRGLSYTAVIDAQDFKLL